MIFCNKGMAILQIKVGFFLAFKQLVRPLFSIVWLFIEIFIWQTWLK